MKFFALTLIWFSLFLGHTQSKDIAITEFSQKDKITGILIDVRTPGEYRAGHLKNAVNIDWFETGFAEKIKALEVGEEEPVYLYCQKGGRSAKAAQVLDSLGYTDVVNLVGGYEAYLTGKE
jgi:rhodanese-related sulfurtransferase